MTQFSTRMSAKCLCCENILKMGCFDSCQVIELDMDVPTNDTYTFQLEFNGQISRWSAEFLVGQKFNIPREQVNSDYTHVFKVFASDGTQLTITGDDDEIEYDCFAFTVLPNTGPAGFTFPGPQTSTPE